MVTIELSPELHAAAAQRFAANPRVNVVLGDAGVELARYVDRHVPALFFLDAHWSGGPTAGEEIDCPILDELEALASGGPEDCILIDDARLFAEPPQWRKAAKWPPLPPRGRRIVEAWERTVNGGKRPLRAQLWRLRPARVRWRMGGPLVSE